MTEEQKLILAIVLLFSTVIALLITFIYFRKVVKKEKSTVDSLEKETYKFYQNLELKDGIYFPYFHTHAAGIRPKSKSKGDKDNITDITIGKNRVFYFDRILYIINNKLNCPYKKETIDNKEFIVLDDTIKTIELLVSFEKPSHFLVKYQIVKLKDGKYKIELMEGGEDYESRGIKN